MLKPTLHRAHVCVCVFFNSSLTAQVHRQIPFAFPPYFSQDCGTMADRGRGGGGGEIHRDPHKRPTDNQQPLEASSRRAYSSPDGTLPPLDGHSPCC